MSTSATKKISATNMPKKKPSKKSKPNVTLKGDVKKFPIYGSTRVLVWPTKLVDQRLSCVCVTHTLPGVGHWAGDTRCQILSEN
jgi:hypothetical protein